MVRNPEDHKRQLVESVLRHARGAEPVAAAWRAASEPAMMIFFIGRLLDDRGLAVRLARDAIAAAREPARFADFDLVLAAVRDETDFVNIAPAFGRLSPDLGRELANAIRVHYTPPFNFSELLAHVDARDGANHAARRRISFARYYERCIEAPVPFAIPPGVTTLGRAELGDDELAVVMIGTAAAQDNPILHQAQVGEVASLRVGYFFAGFWGHGINSYAFYYCDISPARRVYLRIPFGNMDGDIVRERADVRETMRRLAQLEVDAAGGTWRLCLSMGEGEFTWTSEDGSTREIPRTHHFSWDDVSRLVQESRR